MAEEVLGSGISQEVVNQFNLRETLIGSPVKERKQLLFFNGNGAWIRLASSINTQSETEAKDFRTEVENFESSAQEGEELANIQNLGSSLLAKDNVLLGGMYPQGTSPGGGGLLEGRHTPLNIDTKGYITPSVAKLGSYHNYESLGYRPVPGITSVSIQSKNTYGTLREAEVNIVVWTLEDLEVMQALYLRPGYSMLLEWGHSLGLDKDGTLNTDIRVNTEFFTRQKQLDIEKQLLKHTKDIANYNYDAMYGYVSNFSWSFRQDGGYDCTVKIISKGSILESLALAFDTTRVYPSKDVNPENEDAIKYERRSIFHKFVSELGKVDLDDIRAIPVPGYYIPNQRFDKYNRAKDETKNWAVKTITKSNLKPTGNHFKKFLNEFRAYILPVKREVIEEDGDTSTERGYSYYVPLYVLLDIYNNYCTLTEPSQEKTKGKNTGGYPYTQFYTGWQDERGTGTDAANFSTIFKKECKFLTTRYHFSINPLICVLPGQLEEDRNLKFFNKGCTPIKDPADGLNVNGSTTYTEKASFHNLGAIQVGHFDLAVSEYIEEQGEKDDILNILISLDHVTKLIDTILKEDKDSDQNTSNNMTVFLQRLLKDINNSLGGVNDLDILYDEPENLFFIVDRRLTPSAKDRLPEITLSGLNSTVTDLNISSKISSNIASQISISAQATGQGTKDNIGPLLQWNKGLTDRHLTIKSPKKEDEEESNTASDNPERSRLEKWLYEYAEEWSKFKVFKRSADIIEYFFSIDFRADITAQNLESLSEYHKEFCQKYVTEYYFKENKGLPPPGTIPVELSFKTLGIAGLKIGQAFRINRGILPQTYTDNYGFIITGLSHDVSGNKWTTDIKALMFCISPPPSYILKKWENEEACTKEATQDTSPTPEPTPTEETGTPNADRLRDVLRTLGYAEKGQELSNGGDITEDLYRYAASVFRKIKEILPSIFITVTGGNDIFHQGVTYRSAHKTGNGLDFVISPPSQTNKASVDKILGGFAGGNQDKKVSFINEYDYPSSAATAPHFHIRIGDKLDGNPRTKDYIAQANQGALPIYPIA